MTGRAQNPLSNLAGENKLAQRFHFGTHRSFGKFTVGLHGLCFFNGQGSNGRCFGRSEGAVNGVSLGADDQRICFQICLLYTSDAADD